MFQLCSLTWNNCGVVQVRASLCVCSVQVYEKEVKGYVYVLEGTPSTTKIHVPKDNKQSSKYV